MRRRWLVGSLLLALCGAVAAGVGVGDVRLVQPREGVTLRAEPRPMSARQAVLAYRTPVVVTAVEGYWARLRAEDGREGWARVSDVVQPGALTGAGAVQGSGSSDVSLAGRQFDDAVEREFRASDAEMDAAYRRVDEVERAGPRPGDPEVERFAAEGRLGRTR
jgi:hypothetical protein